MFEVGLNPYGLTYHLGLQGHGTPRANPAGAGLDGFIVIGERLGAKTLEIYEPWLATLDDAALAALKVRLARLGMTPIISSGLQTADFASCLRSAHALGAKLIRFALTPILCGDRNAAGAQWPILVAGVREKLKTFAPRASAAGVIIGIENHQDFTSLELVALCQEAGSNVRIIFDTGNTFPVAESPLDFTRVVAPHVCHVHLKDYRVQPTDEGFRLIRCAIGDGAVPLPEMAAILSTHHKNLTAVLEPGALEARHVRLLNPDWWKGYAPKSAQALAACLKAAKRNALDADADYRTPWERGADADLADYELAMIHRCAANMQAQGVMGTETSK
jgi:3-oxoisoapionate decarboxylase